MRVNTKKSLKAVAAAILSVTALALMGRFMVGVDVQPVRPATVGHGELGSIKTSLGKTTKSRDEDDLMLRSDSLKASEDTEYRGTGRNIFKIETQVPRTIVGPERVPLRLYNQVHHLLPRRFV